jgi:hypothetical protein
MAGSRLFPSGVALLAMKGNLAALQGRDGDPI